MRLNQRAVIAAAIGVLRKLGLLDDLDASPVAQWAQADLINAAGIRTGRVRAIPL